MQDLGKLAKTQLTVTFNQKKPFLPSFYITDSSYEKLLALFVGSYFVNTLDEVIPRVTDTDMLNTRDSLGE